MFRAFLSWIWQIVTGSESEKAREFVEEFQAEGQLTFFEAMDRVNQSKVELESEDSYERLVDIALRQPEEHLVFIALYR